MDRSAIGVRNQEALNAGRSRLSVFAELLGHAMPVVKHPVQPWLHHPAEKHIDDRATGQLILHTIGEACLSIGILKLVPMDPFGEGSLDLFVDEKMVLLVRRVQRDPGKYSYAKFHP
jgi:hypothetical protein